MSEAGYIAGLVFVGIVVWSFLSLCDNITKIRKLLEEDYKRKNDE
jgi:hypothetical protein